MENAANGMKIMNLEKMESLAGRREISARHDSARILRTLITAKKWRGWTMDEFIAQVYEGNYRVAHHTVEETVAFVQENWDR